MGFVLKPFVNKNVTFVSLYVLFVQKNATIVYHICIKDIIEVFLSY